MLCCLFRHYNKPFRKRKGEFPRMSVFISLTVAVFWRCPHSPLCLSLDNLERQRQQGAAKADRYMSWEVHIKSLGIHFFVLKKRRRGEKRRVYMSRKGEMGNNPLGLKPQYKRGGFKMCNLATESSGWLFWLFLPLQTSNDSYCTHINGEAGKRIPPLLKHTDK